jgi:hypothetical protein
VFLEEIVGLCLLKKKQNKHVAQYDRNGIDERLYILE